MALVVVVKFARALKPERAGLKQNAANSTAAANNGTGTVAANPEQNAALFLSPVSVGGQILNLDFDSGSSDL